MAENRLACEDQLRQDPVLFGAALSLRKGGPRSGNVVGYCSDQQGDVDILEDSPRRDAKNAFGGFDEVIALSPGLLTAQNVGEG